MKLCTECGGLMTARGGRTVGLRRTQYLKCKSCGANSQVTQTRGKHGQWEAALKNSVLSQVDCERAIPIPEGARKMVIEPTEDSAKYIVRFFKE